MDTDDQSYLQRKYKDVLPSRGELWAIGIFGATSEERDAAKALLQIAAIDDEHPLLLLKRLYPEGSEAARIPDESPIGREIQALFDSNPEELLDEKLEIDVTDKIPLLPLPPAPKSVAAQPVEEIGESLQKLIEPRNPVRRPTSKPNWAVAKPTPPSDDFAQQEPINW
jgi:hypothetical protein